MIRMAAWHLNIPVHCLLVLRHAPPKQVCLNKEKCFTRRGFSPSNCIPASAGGAQPPSQRRVWWTSLQLKAQHGKCCWRGHLVRSGTGRSESNASGRGSEKVKATESQGTTASSSRNGASPPQNHQTLPYLEACKNQRECFKYFCKPGVFQCRWKHCLVVINN